MPYNPKSKENLNPPVKGEIRNPNGRPKGAKTFSSVFKKYLEVDTGKEHPETGDKMSYMDMSILAVLRKATKGDIAAVKLAIEKVDGLSPTNLANYDVSGLSTEELSTLSDLLGKIKPKDE